MPYKKCPVYESAHFVLRFITPEDAADLQRCYADRQAVQLMNADNCDTDFYFPTLKELTDNNIAILRIDICSNYETQEALGELVLLLVANFYAPFQVQHLLVKAIPIATERMLALRSCGFVPVEYNGIMPYGDYYMR